MDDNSPKGLNIETDKQRDNQLSLFALLEQSAGWQLLKKEWIRLAEKLEQDILAIDCYDQGATEDLNEKKYTKIDLWKLHRHALLAMANFPQQFIDDARQRKRENPSAIEFDPFLPRGSHQISPEDIEGEMPI